MINFYHHFIPHAAEFQAPLNSARAGLKANQTFLWTPEFDQAFSACKDNLAATTLLVHPEASASINFKKLFSSVFYP